MARRVSLFVTCVVDQLFPKVGIAMAEVLERIGTAEARRLLVVLANGAREETVTREAQDCLRRLKART